ncbi:unnamed protein product [Rotaria sp. Silwood1]|nr:unnamed protein product [Rotaria sp. Silwood1]
MSNKSTSIKEDSKLNTTVNLHINEITSGEDWADDAIQIESEGLDDIEMKLSPDVTGKVSSVCEEKSN